jgi:hypothetical protein
MVHRLRDRISVCVCVCDDVGRRYVVIPQYS